MLLRPISLGAKEGFYTPSFTNYEEAILHIRNQEVEESLWWNIIISEGTKLVVTEMFCRKSKLLIWHQQTLSDRSSFGKTIVRERLFDSLGYLSLMSGHNVTINMKMKTKPLQIEKLKCILLRKDEMQEVLDKSWCKWSQTLSELGASGFRVRRGAAAEIKVNQGNVHQQKESWSCGKERYSNCFGLTNQRQCFQDLWVRVQRKEIVVNWKGQ